MVNLERYDALVYSEIEAVLTEFPSQFNARSFHEISLLCEFVCAAPKIAELTAFREILARYSLIWVRTGIVENALISAADWVFGLSLIVRLATEAPDFQINDIAVIKHLYESGMIGRSEMSAALTYAMASHLERAGIAFPYPSSAPATIQAAVEKRLLRARTDIADVGAIMCYLHLHNNDKSNFTLRYPGFLEVIYLHSKLHGSISLVSILGLFSLHCSNKSGFIAADVRGSALEWIAHNPDMLFPEPPLQPGNEEFLRNTAKGWRIASSVAAAALLKAIP
jgi:hypothetical protein